MIFIMGVYPRRDHHSCGGMRVRSAVGFSFVLMALSLLSVRGESVRVAISAMILDDGVTSHLWAGDDDRRIVGKQNADLFVLSGERSRAISIPFGAPGRPFVYSGPSEVVFYHEPVSPDPYAPRPSIAGAVTIPDDATDVLLIFVTENFDAQRFRIMVLDVSSDATDGGTFRITNLSRQTIAWNLGENTGMVTPGSSVLVDAPEDKFQTRIRLAQFDRPAEQWRIVYNRVLRPQPDQRYDCLILPRPGSDEEGIMVCFIADTPQDRSAIVKRGGVDLPIVEPPEPDGK